MSRLQNRIPTTPADRVKDGKDGAENFRTLRAVPVRVVGRRRVLLLVAVAIAAAALLAGSDTRRPAEAAATPRPVGDGPAFNPAVQGALDGALTESMKKFNLPGAVVGVWVEGEGQWVTARGVSDLATKAPMRLDHHFRIGSLTKTFTVTALLQLAGRPLRTFHSCR